MWAMITKLLMRLAALRWFLKLGGFGLLVPIVFLLKMIGLPVLAVLSVVALPILLLLFVLGLPIFLVLIVGTMLMGLLGMVLTIGVAALKVGLFVVLPILLVWRIVRWLSRRGGGDGGTTDPGDTGGTGGTGSTGSTGSSSASHTDVPPVDATMKPQTESESAANPTGDPLSGPISDL